MYIARNPFAKISFSKAVLQKLSTSYPRDHARRIHYNNSNTYAHISCIRT